MSLSIEAKIGTGACADVWSATDRLERKVAVKILRTSAPYYADALAHAKALARAQHPNVITIYSIENVIDPETSNQVDGIIMEYVSGSTLQQKLQQSDLLTIEQAYSIAIGIINGLEHIHSVGLVHNDLHCANVLVNQNVVKIIDILYTDSLINLTIGTKGEKIKHDIRNLTTMLYDIAQHSRIDKCSLKEFGLSLNESMISIEEIRNSIEKYFNSKDHPNAVLSESLLGDRHAQSVAAADAVTDMLNERLNQALRTFSSHPSIWIDRTLCDPTNISRNADDNADRAVDLCAFIRNPQTTIIKAPPQFGLTSLAHHMIKEAWVGTASRWLYLDASALKPSTLEKTIRKELERLRLSTDNVKCVILDSWTNYEKESMRLLKDLCDLFKDVPLIVMQTLDDLKFITAPETGPTESINREFRELHLLALPRRQIRKIVAAYNKQQHIGDEEAILSKVVSDLEALNIHRTPLNCITLLKVAEKYFDESPVNRTKLLEMVLHLLFNTDGIPTYKVRPDMKDCEHVLGRFCEKMIRTGIYGFSRQDFLKELNRFCTEKLIDLEVDVVFDTLFLNNIIIKRNGNYEFRFSYWIYYFAAQRMHGDAEFAAYIFSEERYASFPEVIEFYTGIDRRRDDALRILLQDLRNSCNAVVSKVNLPEKISPYALLQWHPTDADIAKMNERISEDVLKSNLPMAVKDRYADSSYNQIRPYDQTVYTVLKEYSLLILMQNIKAASRALRNSDYVAPDIKRELLSEIMKAWEQISNVILVLAPFLATRGHAMLEGVHFILSDGFGDTFSQRVVSILCAVPFSVVSSFKDNLSSNKMGPLLFDFLNNEKTDLKRHQMALMITVERPREWKKHIEDYIATLSRNSFYLQDLLATLETQYRFSFASSGALSELEYLIKVIVAKHQTGSKKPGMHEVARIPQKILPKRESIED